MKCVICDGEGIRIYEDQQEICYNCDGTGEIVLRSDKDLKTSK